MIAVHQEADRAQVQAEDRADIPIVEHVVQRIEHRAIAAQRDQGIGLFLRHEIVAFAQFLRGFARPVALGIDQAKLFEPQVIACHELSPPRRDVADTMKQRPDLQRECQLARHASAPGPRPSPCRYPPRYTNAGAG